MPSSGKYPFSKNVPDETGHAAPACGKVCWCGSLPPTEPLSIRLLRFLIVLVGLSALGGFGWTFSDFVRHRSEYLAPFDLARFEQGFDLRADDSEIHHLKDWSAYHDLYDLNVTGEVQAAPTAGGPVVQAPPPLISESDLEVCLIQFAAPDSAQNRAYLRPKGATIQQDRILGSLYAVGDRFELPEKKGVEIEVLAIREDAVDVGIVGRPGKVFTLRPAIYEVDPKRITGDASLVSGPLGPAPPQRTRLVDSNVYAVGSEDYEAFSKMKDDDILAAVKLNKKYDRASGKVLGLRVTHLQSDSVFSRQGIRPDDVILEVNGVPATDRATLLQRLRQQGPRDRITVKLERAGAVRTYTYRLPRR